MNTKLINECNKLRDEKRKLKEYLGKFFIFQNNFRNLKKGFKRSIEGTYKLSRRFT